MTGGGKYELRTLELRERTPLDRATVLALVAAAVALDAQLGDPTVAQKPLQSGAQLPI